MEFKKRMLSDYTGKLNQILTGYREEYQEIIRQKQEELNKNLLDAMENKENTKNEDVSICVEFPDDPVEAHCKEEIDNTPNKNTCEINESILFESSFNCLGATTNQSFFMGEVRRRARRRTGRTVVKRKHNFEDTVKRRRTDVVENFLKAWKRENQAAEMKAQDSDAKVAGIQDETMKIEAEKQELEKIRKENLEIAKKMHDELKELQNFKDQMYKEIVKIQEEKEKIEKEREEAYQRRLEMERMALEAEKTMIAEQKKKFEEMKNIEVRTLIENEKKKLEMERKCEIEKILIEKTLLEKKMAEQSVIFENERRLLLEEREKMNQTFFEMTSRKTVNPNKTKDAIIQLPESIKTEVMRKRSIQRTATRPINELFQAAKREHIAKVNQSVLITQPRIKEPTQILKRGRQSNEEEKINAHSLYKRSIDAQTGGSDPKKYVPKTQIPFYTSESEFDSEEKKFEAALFTKDPKLNYIVKSQDHEEIRRFFGKQRDIDVETIFSGIQNVTNYSPNKPRKITPGK